ncbi:DNA-3-methyladenine glycosylase [Halopenitus sp. H-Gu1]|uniref:DNA-3-methyladenine glycosylase family protein n=1 Tax=Halopenitus sp. H-Gu1 TaxID=3242697 RepID=UPI00359CFD52
MNRTLPSRVEPVLREDPVLARLVDRHGALTVTAADEPFRRLCTSIINQQLSTASADAIRERMIAVLDDEVTPGSILDADEDRLQEAGLSESKVEYLHSAAAAFEERDLTPAGLSGASDEEVIAELTRIRGIGEWTARMYLIFVLGREDVLPLSDLAVRRGIEQLYADDGTLTREEMRGIAEAWRPYRSYGTRYVWAEYER